MPEVPQEKLRVARQLIQLGHARLPAGAICWSGGKDSMVLLHMMRSLGIALPVVFFREPWQPRKYAFHDSIIRRWELQILSWHPSGVAFQQREDEFELQNLYHLGDRPITCPTGIVPPADGLPWACAIDMAKRPTQERLDVFPPFQALWIGHKRTDRDVMLGGDAGTRVHAKVSLDEHASFFPLRDWSDEDIWNYIHWFQVPYDEERYHQRADGSWGEREHRRQNADYVHACTRCIDSRADAPRFVECPKLGLALVENIAGTLPWVEPRKPSYMSDPESDPPDGA